MKIKKQSGPMWADETGMQIPSNRLTPSEKLRESKAYMLAMHAATINEKLAAFKTIVAGTCDDVIAAIRAENGIKPDGKGNITWYNFDRSIKVEVNVNEAIRFDDVMISGAKDKLMQLIDENISGDDFVKALVQDAFQTTAGRLDTRRVLGLKRHTSRIKDKQIKALWDEAMELIDKSVTRPDSKTYFRISTRTGRENEYEVIDLNFSSVKA